MRIALPATTDYWANDSRGEPLLVVTADANAGMVAMLPKILREVRALVGERRVTVVFDRGGWSPKLFAEIVTAGFDFLTYRKGRFPRLPSRCFKICTAVLNGRRVSYHLADREIRLLGGKLRARQVTRLTEQGRHQTPSSRRAVICQRSRSPTGCSRGGARRTSSSTCARSSRSTLVDYGVEPDDATREVPNPRWIAIDAKLRDARDRVAEITRRVGAAATLRSWAWTDHAALCSTEPSVANSRRPSPSR